MGRPQKFKNEEIITALKAAHGLVYIAARRLGCSPNTIYSRAARVRAIQTVIDDSRSELVDLAESQLRTLLDIGDPWAVGFTLKTLGKRRGYVEKTITEHSGAVSIDGSPPLLPIAELVAALQQAEDSMHHETD
jgi:hypothetical protein